jgi:hypothetical protein
MNSSSGQSARQKCRPGLFSLLPKVRNPPQAIRPNGLILLPKSGVPRSQEDRSGNQSKPLCRGTRDSQARLRRAVLSGGRPDCKRSPNDITRKQYMPRFKVRGAVEAIISQGLAGPRPDARYRARRAITTCHAAVDQPTATRLNRSGSPASVPHAGFQLGPLAYRSKQPAGHRHTRVLPPGWD